MADRKMTPNQHAKRIREIQASLQRMIPTKFREAVQYIRRDCLMEIETLVPQRTRGRQAKGLYKGEEIVELTDTRGVIRNTATNNGYPYGVAVHQGLPPRVAPTKLNGKFAYIWTNKETPRPTSPEAWKAARAAGAVIVAKRLKGVAARPWRYNVVMRDYHILSQFQMEVTRLIFNGY